MFAAVPRAWCNGPSAACGAVVRYTTNGSEPTGSSSIFPSSGVTIQTLGPHTIKAKTFAGGWTTSPMLTLNIVIGDQLIEPPPDPEE